MSKTPPDIKKLAAQIKRKRTVKLAQIGTKAYNQYRKGDVEGMSAIIIDSFIELGGVYVKFLQGVLLRSEHLKNSTSAKKLDIFEDLDSEPIDLEKFLRYQLTPEKFKQIASINPVPFAAGSFGQVYYAIHADGTPIVLKVLRPLIKETLTYDLKLIKMFSKRFAKKGWANMDMDINETLNEFCQATLRETDYVEEARFANELYEHYKGNEKFVIPNTYIDLCTPSLIVQEFINGISGAQLVKLRAQGIEPKDYVASQLGSDIDDMLVTLGYELLYGVFTLDKLQGDPHPGNIRFLPNNKVGLIDFGISARTPKEKAAFLDLLREYEKLYRGHQDVANMFNQFLRFFVSDLYHALKKLNSMMPQKVSDEDFTKVVGNLAEEAFRSEMGDDTSLASLMQGSDETKLMRALNKMVNKDNRFGLVMRLEASEMTRASQTYLSLVESLGRRAQVLEPVFTRVIRDVELNLPQFVDDPRAETGISEALEIISSWLERIAERDPRLFQKLVQRIRIRENIVKQEEQTHA